MIRRVLILASLVAVSQVGFCGASASAGEPKQPPDLSGRWRLDPSRSEQPNPPMRGGGGGGRMGRRGGGGGGGFRGGGRGGWGGHGDGDGDSARVGSRPPRLPESLQIAQSTGSVILEDSSGTAIEAIYIKGETPTPGDVAASVPRLTGEWKGDRLEVKRDAGRGGTITETFALVDKGRALELKTKVEGRRSFSFKRVYTKAGA